MHAVLMIGENAERRLPKGQLQITAVHRRIEIALFQHVSKNVDTFIQNPPELRIVLEFSIRKVQAKPLARRRCKPAHDASGKNLVAVPCAVMPHIGILAITRIRFIVHTVKHADIGQLIGADCLPAGFIRIALFNQLLYHLLYRLS